MLAGHSPTNMDRVVCCADDVWDQYLFSSCCMEIEPQPKNSIRCFHMLSHRYRLSSIESINRLTSGDRA